MGTIPAHTVSAGETATVDVSPYFRDPDADALFYAAASSNAGVASVSVAGSSVTLTALAKGVATVTVEARDPQGLIAQQGFQLTVPNRIPEAVEAIPAQTLFSGETASVDASAYFRDPDGDPLTYFAASANADVATVTTAAAAITIRAVTPGITTVTVSAEDQEGGTVEQLVHVTVPNRGPAPVGSMPAHTVLVGETVTVDVSSYFDDPDGDDLTYAAVSSNTSVAMVSVSGAAVAIRGVAVGSVTLTVTAHDPSGHGATQEASVEVTATAPDLAFTGVSPASATLTPGDSITFTFRIRNQGAVASSATTIRTMRSANPTISPRDTELESYSLPPLGPSQDRRFPVTIVVDKNSAPGTLYIGMCVDAVTDESNTRNNCSEGARLMIVRSSGARKSLESGPSVRIWVSRPRESKPPPAPL